MAEITKTNEGRYPNAYTFQNDKAASAKDKIQTCLLAACRYADSRNYEELSRSGKELCGTRKNSVTKNSVTKNSASGKKSELRKMGIKKLHQKRNPKPKTLDITFYNQRRYFTHG